MSVVIRSDQSRQLLVAGRLDTEKGRSESDVIEVKYQASEEWRVTSSRKEKREKRQYTRAYRIGD